MKAILFHLYCMFTGECRLGAKPIRSGTRSMTALAYSQHYNTDNWIVNEEMICHCPESHAVQSAVPAPNRRRRDWPRQLARRCWRGPCQLERRRFPRCLQGAHALARYPDNMLSYGGIIPFENYLCMVCTQYTGLFCKWQKVSRARCVHPQFLPVSLVHLQRHHPQ